MGITGFSNSELEKISTRFIADKEANVEGAQQAFYMWNDYRGHDSPSVIHVFENLSSLYMDQIRSKLIALKLEGTRLRNADQLK